MPIGVVKVIKEKGKEKWLINELEFKECNLRQIGWGKLSKNDIVDGLDVEYNLQDQKIQNVRRYVPITKSIRKILDNLNDTDEIRINTSLALDKLVYRYSEVEFAKIAIEKIVTLNNEKKLEKNLLNRWEKIPYDIKFTCKTTSPLALHLARASALENAGICLHPIYGFAYIPGSGLKGMARAYAETVWLQQEGNSNENKEKILAVFGNDPGEKVYEKQKAGAIVFHDAFPTSWPRLIIDIVNCHHPEYYNGESEDGPGDWENPIPNYFLAVEAGTKFQFALSKRQADADESLELAKEWLLGALCQLGAGAKTNAGYGAFTPTDKTITVKGYEKSKLYEATLHVVSPAFIGNANQEIGKPALRASSLKGMLRFWWRTMHGDWSLDKLRSEEARIFGSIDIGTGLQVKVVEAPPPSHFPKGSDMGKGGSPLGYMGYGPIQYDKSSKKNLTQRNAIAPASKIRIILHHQDEEALKEAQKALWLLGAFGGLGARSRRGWGSVMVESQFAELPNLLTISNNSDLALALHEGSLAVCQEANRQEAESLHWTAFGKDSQIFVSKEKFTSWREALENIGRIFQNFRNEYGLNRGSPNGHGPDYFLTKNALEGKELPRLPERACFGLPYAQEYRSLDKRAEFTPILYANTKNEKEGRRASPLFYKIIKVGNAFAWVVLYLPSKFLPDHAKILAKEKKTKMELGYFPVLPPSGIKGGLPGNSDDSKSTVPNDSTLILDFLKKIKKNFASSLTPSSPAPTTSSNNHSTKKIPNQKIGTVIEKLTKRTAVVELDNGEKLKAGQAKQYSTGDKVKIEQLPTGEWIIIEKI